MNRRTSQQISPTGARPRASARYVSFPGLLAVTLSSVTAPTAMAQEPRQEDHRSDHSLLERQAGLDVRAVTLEAALTRLARSAGVRVVFSPSLLRAEERRVTCDCERLSVGEALGVLLRGTPFGFSVIDGQIALIATRSTVGMPAAQAVTGAVTEHGTGSPLAGVFVALLDDEERQVAGVLTDDRGRFRLPAPGPGSYTLRADRIGFRTVRSPAIEVGPGGTTYRFELQSRPVNLAGLVVEAETRECRLRPDEGSRLQAIWDQIRAALEVAAWTESTGYLRGEQLTYERWMDPVSGRVQDETLRGRRTYGGVGFAAASAEELVTGGFVQLRGEEYVFYGLDAATIVSDAFLDTHCFRLRAAAGGEDGWIGLAFEPTRGRTVPGVEGVLWIDEATAELRRLEYGYTWLPWLLPVAPFGGETLFRRLPGGAWIVERWTIRMPQLARLPADPARLRPGRDVLSRLRDEAGLLIKEEGGAVAAIFMEPGLRLPGPERAALQGVILDGGRHQFYERMERVRASGGGTVFDRAEIERRRAARLTQLVGQAPGVRIATVVHDGVSRPVIGSLRAYSGFGLCPMSVYVDGVAVLRGGPGALESGNAGFRADGDSPPVDDMVFAPDLDAVEIYHPGDWIPPRFRSRDSGCGVVLVWTRLEA